MKSCYTGATPVLRFPWTRHGGRLGEAGSLVGARVTPTSLKSCSQSHSFALARKCLGVFNSNENHALCIQNEDEVAA